MELLGELLVVVRLIEANAKDLDVFRLVVFEEVPEPGPFGRSAGCVGLRKKPKQDLLSAEVAELHATCLVIGHLEIGRRIANLQHGSTSEECLPGVAQRSLERHARIVRAMDWESRYRSGDFGPSQPHRLIIEAAAMLPAGRALDLACGAGRNARYLAERGWRVIAVDLSVAAVRMVGVPVVLADLERHALPFADDTFDLVCIINFLHRPLFAEAQRVGRSVAAAIRTSGHYSLSPDELRSYFAGCRIVVDREGEIIAIKGNEASS